MTTPRNRSTLRLLALVLLLATLAAPPVIAHPEDAGTASEPLLVFDESLHQLTPLQPDTLTPIADLAVSFGNRVSSWSFARSADGSTLVNLDDAHPRVVTVRDGQTGQERHRFDTGRTISNPILSANGERLLLDDPATARGWHLFDVATGTLIASFTAPEGWVEPVTTSPDLARLYYLTIPTNDPTFEGQGEPNPELVAVDLTTGIEIGRTLLPEIVSGAESVDETASAEGEPLYHLRMPGIAVSPDGARIAIVRGDRAGFTLVNAASLTVERTESISEPQGSLRRFLTWLSILPRSASAKMGTGDVISAAFSPDASRLYIWGFRITPEPDEGREVSHGIGLLAIDVASGEITAEGPDGQLIQRLESDGTALYITGPTSGQAIYSWTPGANIAEFNVPHYLDRLDPETLTLQASVEFPDPIWLSAPTRTED